MVEYVGNVYAEENADVEALSCPYPPGWWPGGGCVTSTPQPNPSPCVLIIKPRP